EADPEETKNLADDKPDIVSQLRAILSRQPEAKPQVRAVGGQGEKKSGGCPLFSFVLSWHLERLIRKHRIDVLHVHAGSGGVVLLTKPSCPLVVTAHHTCGQEADLVFRGRPIKQFFKRCMGRLERRTYRLADRITAVSIDSAVRHVLDADAHIDEPTQPDVKPDMTGELSSGPELFVAEGRSIHDRRGAACDKTQQSVLVLEHQVRAHRSYESGFTPPGQEPPRHFELGMELPSGTQIGFPGQTVDPIDFHLVETIAGPVGREARPQTHGIEKVITRQDDPCAYQQTTHRYERHSPHILPFHRSQFRNYPGRL
ncbi:MAG: glycosyltransferase, partial [bacterium]